MRGSSALRRLAVAALMGWATGAGVAQTFEFDTPSDDRWQYPFNFFPGTRPTISTFSSLGTGVPSFSNFNDRDGIALIAWDTSGSIPVGQGAYAIDSVTVIVRNEPNATWPIDLTVDEWFTTDVNNDALINVDGIPRGFPGDSDGESDDADAGRPVELFGMGFGPVYTTATWTQGSAFVGGTDQANNPRDPFPLVFQDGTGADVHVEDHVKGLHNGGLTPPIGAFTPTPWAIGAPVAYTPGSQTVPFEVAFAVDLELSGGAVRAYFEEQLDAGKVFVSLASLTDTVLGGTVGGVPSFYAKEGIGLHPDARAPKLVIVLSEAIDGDVNGDGCVDLSDLGTLLSNFGLSGGLEFEDGDLNGDDKVDLSDLGIVLANYLSGC